MTNKTCKEVLKDLDLRFTSGNDIPVDRAVITREDYEVLKLYIHELQLLIITVAKNTTTAASIMVHIGELDSIMNTIVELQEDLAQANFTINRLLSSDINEIQ